MDFKCWESKPPPQNSPPPLGHTHSAKEIAERLAVHATAALAAEHTHLTLSSVKTADLNLWLAEYISTGWPRFSLEPEYFLLASFFLFYPEASHSSGFCHLGG